jgi:hypothetical protein
MAEIMTVLHECADFNRWKPVFDADAPNRKAAGLTDLLVLRHADKPNLLAVVMGVSDRSKAQAMATSPQLREAMQKGGIIGQPEVHFRQGELDAQQAPSYLSLNCKIRDLATFRKAYAMDKADRGTASMTDLGLLTEVDDPTDLLLVWSVKDKAKADAFLSSPTLAEHQVKNAGVVSAPKLRYWTPA